jgi:hypothetical protein
MPPLVFKLWSRQGSQPLRDLAGLKVAFVLVGHFPNRILAIINVAPTDASFVSAPRSEEGGADLNPN